MSVVPSVEPARPGAAQRRYLTVFFSDLSDSTRLAAGMEAELYAELLDQVRHACRTAIAGHGGTVVRLQGDGVLAIFGYPQAREDDARRATQAALDLHAAVRGLRVDGAPARLSLHTGIHSGLVLLDEGDLVRGRFELLGDAPNVAARLSDAAEHDEILVSAETLGPESHFFQLGGQRLLRLKGKAEPVAVCPVLGRAPVATRLAARARRGLLPFVGRQGELERLECGLADALAGRSRCLALVAAPGLGKTRLADEFVQRAAARGCRILRGYCESYLGAEPLQPFVQMLRAVLGLDQAAPGAAAAQAVRDALARIDPALLAHQAELLRALSIAAPDAPAPARAEAGGPLDALCALFDRLARDGPMVVFVDDWQWADDASRQVLDAIRRLDRPGMLVLIATRGFEAGDTDTRGAELIRLAPFDEREAAQTIDRLLPGTDPFLAAEIRRYAGGSPLFIEELCHFAAQPDADRRLGRPHGAAAWLDILIESRVARLPPQQAELVRTAAVIGNVIPAWLLQDLTGCAEDDPVVQALAEQDFIFPGDKPGTLRFKHGITRDVVYDAVGLRQRRALHLRIAEAMRRRAASGAQDEAHEALAYHYDAAGCAAEAAHHAELAGDKALAASALDRAQAQYRAALAALDRLPDSDARDARWHAIAQRLGMACVFDPSREQLDVFGRAVERAAARGDQAALAQAHYWLGYVHYALGESHAAIHHCQAALQGARRMGADDRLVVQMLATLGQARAAAGQYAGAAALLDEAIAIKRRHRTGTGLPVGFCYALATKASILGDQGLFEPAHACFGEALDALRGTEHEVKGSVLCWQSAVCLWQGRWDDALEAARQAQRIGERVKSLYVFAMGRALGAYAEWNTQRPPAAARAILEATSWLQARGRELCISLNYGWLADVLVCEGRFAQARQRAACTLARARRHDRLGEAMACRAMARAAAQGHARRSEAHYLDLAMRAAQARGSRREAAATDLCRAQLALARGDLAAAAAPLDRAQAAFEAMHMRWHFEQAERLRSAMQD